MEEDILKEESQNKEGQNSVPDCEKQRDEYLDGWKRAKADLINYKKDESKRFETIVKFANEAIVKDLITVLDSFDLALATLEGDENSKTQKGLYLIRRQLEDIMGLSGLERVVISVGQPFDPGLQEAVAEVESDKPSGIIVEEVEKGYTLHGKLIRPARVKVAK
ncbi:MAG: nucleotide exchange factor GrpE [Candidatus Paceibacterota bacterium]